MLAAVFQGNGVLELIERPEPVIHEPDEVKLKIIACGICGSDLQALKVPPGERVIEGTIMGHEIYGEVAEIGSCVTEYAVGDFCSVDPNLKCGVCDECKQGKVNMCSMIRDASYGQLIDGAFAPYLVVKAKSLVKYPKRVPGCVGAQTEPLACALNGISKLRPTPADRVLLYGAGPVGLLYMRSLLFSGVRHLIVCDTAPYRREFAEKNGAPVTVDPTQTDMDAFLKEQWGKPATIVIDAVGAGAVMEQALYLLGKNGRYLGFGINAQAKATISPMWINLNEITIMGSFLGKWAYPDAIEYLLSEEFGAKELVSHKFLLEDILEAFEVAKSGKGARIVIYPNGFDE